MNDDLIADACWIVPTDPALPVREKPSLGCPHCGKRLHDMHFLDCPAQNRGRESQPLWPKGEEESVKIFGPVLYHKKPMVAAKAADPSQMSWANVIKRSLDAYIKREQPQSPRLLPPPGAVCFRPPSHEVSWKFRLQDNGDDTLSLLLPDDDPTPHIGRFHADDREQSLQR